MIFHERNMTVVFFFKTTFLHDTEGKLIAFSFFFELTYSLACKLKITVKVELSTHNGF